MFHLISGRGIHGDLIDASLLISAATRQAPALATSADAVDAVVNRALVFGKARLREDGSRHADIAIPVFGYKSHASIDRRHGFIRRWDVTDASRHDGRMPRRGLLDRTNTGATVWADSAYRSRANEAFMERHGFRSQVHHRKPQGRPMPPHIRRGNASRSSVCAGIEHVFAQQKGPMDLCIRTIGIARAEEKIGLANLAYNIDRLIFQERRTAVG